MDRPTTTLLELLGAPKKDTMLNYSGFVGEIIYFHLVFSINIKLSPTWTKYFNLVFFSIFCPGHVCFRIALVFSSSIFVKINNAGSQKKFVKTALFDCY